MKVAAFLLAFAAAAALAGLAAASLSAAADGWRAGFILLSSAPIGAVTLLLIARVVGTDWDAALMPLLHWMPWLGLIAVPLVLGQAIVHWPAGHLHLWLSPPAFALRSALALLFWGWTARALARGRSLQARALLLAHGFVVSVMGYDWLLGSAPAQPNSAAPMMLAVMQIGAAAAFACAARLGTAAQRRDLAYLIVASALGLAYLIYMDFVIVWFGDLPEHVGWYAQRYGLSAILPATATAIGLFAPILLVGIGRSDAARRQAGGLALLALALILAWFSAGSAVYLGLLALLATVVMVGGTIRGVTA